MNTGENEQGLRKILDFTRLGAMIVLFLHIYFHCYQAFKVWGWTAEISDNLLKNIYRSGLFETVNRSKVIALGLLVISLIGARGKKNEHIRLQTILTYILIGLLLYFGSYFALKFTSDIEMITAMYSGITILGFILMLSGGTLLSRYLKLKLSKDIFNQLNETFPQEERLLENEFSINLPAVYNLKGKLRKSWINIINPFRSFLVIGSPGSGKSWFVIQHVIKQHIKKGFTMFVYDFKYDDLSRIAYNQLKKNRGSYKKLPEFYTINFDDLSTTHRCNPLDPSTMYDITDATESSRSVQTIVWPSHP